MSRPYRLRVLGVWQAVPILKRAEGFLCMDHNGTRVDITGRWWHWHLWSYACDPDAGGGRITSLAHAKH